MEEARRHEIACSFWGADGGTRGFSAVVQRSIAHDEPGVINRMQTTLTGALRIVCFSLS